MSSNSFRDTIQQTFTLPFMTLGNRIKTSRVATGLTQVQLGDLVGVTKGAVSNWEKDRDNPTLDNLREIGHACSVSLAWLHVAEGAEPLTREQLQALEIVAALDDKSRASWFQVGNILSQRQEPTRVQS